MASDRIGTKFQFEPVISNPDDKELKYFQLWFSGADNTRWKKV